MPKRINQIKSIVDTLLERGKFTQPPINVEQIATEQKITVRKAQLGDISGLIFREGDQVMIGVNENHHENRRRFTIAHELGHFFLHSKNPLFIDKVFAVKLRDHVSSEAIDKDEIEANAFAGELLMPSKFLIEDFSKAKSGVLDYEDGELVDIIRNLAERYQVSTHAMTVRLIKLGVIQDIL